METDVHSTGLYPSPVRWEPALVVDHAATPASDRAYRLSCANDGTSGNEYTTACTYLCMASPRERRDVGTLQAKARCLAQGLQPQVWPQRLSVWQHFSCIAHHIYYPYQTCRFSPLGCSSVSVEENFFCFFQKVKEKKLQGWRQSYFTANLKQWILLHDVPWLSLFKLVLLKPKRSRSK